MSFGGEETKGTVQILLGASLTLLDGLIGGLISGAVMSAWKMSTDLLRSAGLWEAPKLISAIALGPQAYDGGHTFEWIPVTVGFTLHELTSAAMGVAFIYLLRLPSVGRFPLISALIYSFVSWILAQWVLIPWLSPTMAANTPPLQLALAHIVYGLALGGYLGWRIYRQTQSRQKS